MELLKKFTCLVACFVVLSSSFMVGYAVDDYLYTADDLIDMGFVYDGEAYVYSGDDDPFDLGFSFYFTNQKNSPNFNPCDLPWLQMPDYVKKIINMEVSSYMPSSNNLNIPIVVVRVRPSLVEVYVGINCFLGRLSNASGSFSLFSSNNSADLYSNSRCYTAIYTHNGSIYQDWAECSFIEYGDLQSVYQVAPYFFGNMDTGNLDYYVWGGNAARIGNSTFIAFPVDSTDPNITISLFQSSAGFSSGRFLRFQDQYPFQYFEYFSPPTNDDLSNQLQQEQNSLLDEQNNKLDDMMDATGKPDSIVDDYNDAESDLIDDYDPDNLQDDLEIELDSSALSFIWDLFDEFVTADYSVFTLFISILSIGIIALILGR